MVALYAYATLRAKDSKAGFVASAVLLVLTSASFSLRPQMLGYLFLILTLIILERFRQGKVRSLWFLPPLFLVWVNAHGSWIIGLGVVFVYWASGLLEFRLGGLEAKRWTPQDRRSLSMAFLLSLCAFLITHYGPQIAAYPFEVAFKMPIGVGNVSEWQSMPFNLPGGKLFLGLILAFLVLQVIYRFTWRLEELALFLFGTMMACLHLRFLLLFVPFSTPILATILARWVPPYSRSKDRYLLNAVLMLAVTVGIVRFFPSRAEEVNMSWPFLERPRGLVPFGPSHSGSGESGMLLSVVVPCMNEEEVLRETNRRLIFTLEGISLSFEIIYVDDGSTDATAELLRDLQAHDPRIRVVRFSRNFGHQIAKIGRAHV